MAAINPIADYRKALSIMRHPVANTGAKMTVNKAVKFYYSASVIPVILIAVFEIIFKGPVVGLVVPILASMPYLTQILNGQYGAALLILMTLAFFWIAEPIAIYINSFFYHVFPKFIFRQVNGKFANTVTAYVYGLMPFLTLSWITMLLILLVLTAYFAGFILIPLIVLLMVLVLGLWDLVVFVAAYAHQHDTESWRALACIIGSAMVIVILASAISAVIVYAEGLL